MASGQSLAEVRELMQKRVDDELAASAESDAAVSTHELCAFFFSLLCCLVLTAFVVFQFDC